MTALLDDQPYGWPVTASEHVWQGRVIGVRRDTLEATADTAQPFHREVVSHPGAVAVVAVNADREVLVIRQYRHAARAILVELPAGLLDQPGEPPLEAAKRELQEEGLIQARCWTSLLDYRPSPGFCDEVIHVFLAEGVEATEPPAGFNPEHEEATLTRSWVALDALVEAVASGHVSNGLTITASLFASRFLDENRRRGGS